MFLNCEMEQLLKESDKTGCGAMEAGRPSHEKAGNIIIPQTHISHK